MKKIVSAAIAALFVVGNVFAIDVRISANYGQNVATWAKTDNDQDVDDGLFFTDDYFDNKVGQQYISRGNYDFMTFSEEGTYAGVEATLKVMSKELGMRLYNAWLGLGGFRFYVGRFDAYPLVDIVEDATVGHHFNSYAALYRPGFDPQVMSLFLREEGFRRHANSRIVSTASERGMTISEGYVSSATKKISSSTKVSNINTTVTTDLESYNWYFYDANNAGTCIDYDTTYFGNRGGMMAQYALGEELLFRFVSTYGSTWSEGGSYINNSFGEKTFTNFNAQASYALPDIFKAALTFKMSDIVSGIYTDGDAALESAGSDIQAMLSLSSDCFENLALYADYLYGATFLGMEDDSGTSDAYGFHAADFRAVFSPTERLKFGVNGNLSAIVQSDYAKSEGYTDNYLGFLLGISASYEFSELISFDFDAGFRCLNVNNRNSDDEKDWRQVSCIGGEVGTCLTLARNCTLNLGVNVLYQNLSRKDEGKSVWLNNNKNSLADNTVFPGTIVVTVPLYMKVSL